MPLLINGITSFNFPKVLFQIPESKHLCNISQSLYETPLSFSVGMKSIENTINQADASLTTNSALNITNTNNILSELEP